MDENNYKDQFEALTENMKLEKLFDDLVNRAELARVIAMHSAEVYKAARKAGLPRKAAAYMARGYWDYETQPSSVYMIEGDE